MVKMITSFRMFPLFYKYFTRAVLALLLSWVAIAHGALSDASRIYHSTPQVYQFEICSGGGCAEIHQVSLSLEEWQTIADIFTLNTSDENPANAERRTQKYSKSDW